MSLRAISRSVRFLTIVQERSIRPVFTTAGLTGRGKPSWNSQNKECIERTQIILRDRLKLDNLFIAPTFNKNIRELFNFFPLTPDKVESILLDHPDIVNHEAEKVIEYIKVLVDAGDYDTITQEEALLCLARCPELLKVKIGKLKEKLSNIFGLSAVYDIPWNMVIVSSPSSLLMNPSHSAFIVESLTKYFDVERIRDVIGNNPCIFESDWRELETKIRYLQHTMHVSAYRIAMTPNSLTRDLEFFKLRYDFLLRSGNYRHPDPSARSALPQESSPALHLITETDEERFVHKCCPGLSLEEFNIFKTVLMEEEGQNHLEEDEEVDYTDDDRESNTYTVPTKGTKIVYKPKWV